MIHARTRLRQLRIGWQPEERGGTFVLSEDEHAAGFALPAFLPTDRLPRSAGTAPPTERQPGGRGSGP
ncbi:hypothetical protein E1211_03645 [Micromonospora sp. 15K316]|uniref:hypothetical protein n=1 Tax=Micromonospora sp. 15K316 TaxID=2530376 RepID=UPI00105308F7|nr:hypothetical protein [Micromonospora sp. 15K316]TDC39657.1 hypothetical protein E1211_03645 [Micromonospora sp. 15K316]